MKHILYFFCLLMLSACATCKPPTISTVIRDSLLVKTRYHTIFIDDTIRVRLPAERTEQTVRQDSSHLETSVAISDARINPDGSLTHSLENKPDDQNIPTKRPIEYRDSIVYRDREVEVEKIVPVERELTWWQQTQIRGFWVAILIIVVILRKKIFPLIRRFI